MNNISFLQQEDFDYIPLMLGLSMITHGDVNEIDIQERVIPIKFIPLKYTARMKSMDGDYVVVRGIRHDYSRVEPVIKIRLKVEYLLSMKTGRVHKYEDGYLTDAEINLDKLAEQCLGIEGVTFEQLKRKLLKINKNATSESVFYIHKIDRLYTKKDNNTGMKNNEL